MRSEFVYLAFPRHLRQSGRCSDGLPHHHSPHRHRCHTHRARHCRPHPFRLDSIPTRTPLHWSAHRRLGLHQYHCRDYGLSHYPLLDRNRQRDTGIPSRRSCRLNQCRAGADLCRTKPPPRPTDHRDPYLQARCQSSSLFQQDQKDRRCPCRCCVGCCRATARRGL